MGNIKTLIRIVFVIFIMNGIDCLGSNNCCNLPKDENNTKKENITTDGNITAESLVNNNWFKAKKNNLVLKIFEKEDNGIFTSKGIGDKVSFKLDEKDNSKIAYQDENENKLKLKNEKYALFEIKTKRKNTVYLYCSDVESDAYDNGIFEGTTHISISVIACDTTTITKVAYMFYKCNSLKNLDIKNFNTSNITDMHSMFYECSSLTELDLNNFDTSKVKDMGLMFYECSSLIKLDLKYFDTTNVTDMECMFYKCNSLKKINFGNNFNTENVTDMSNMFEGCNKLADDITNKFSNKNK